MMTMFVPFTIKFVENAESGEREATFKPIADFRYHPSIIDTAQFGHFFAREQARFFLAKALVDCEYALAESISKAYGITEKQAKEGTRYDNVPETMQPVLTVTLCAHGYLFDGVTEDENDVDILILKRANIGFGTLSKPLYTALADQFRDFRNEKVTIEDVAKAVKPLYEDAVSGFFVEAEDGMTKKWTESTKLHTVVTFVTTMFGGIKVTKNNYLAVNNALKSKSRFDRELAKWFSTGGEFAMKQQKATKEVTVWDFINR